MRHNGQALAINVMHFLRMLRFSGLPVGPGKMLLAIEALAGIDIHRREDVYWALHAVCVERHSQSDLFRMAFDYFWTAQVREESGFDSLDDVVEQNTRPQDNPLPRRLAEALMQAGLASRQINEATEIEFDSKETWSAVEQLRSKDFETMSADEQAVTKRVMQKFRLPIPDIPNRRFRPHPAGRRIDMRATLRNTVRTGSFIDLKHKKRVRRHPPLVVLCDISGSMSRYSRMFLHFVHAITNDRDRVHTFVFGTRLTNITRHLRHRDVDIALAKVSEGVEDWSGGTRIGHCLHDFNTSWSRRVLGQGAVVLMISDGLDRDAGEGIGAEIERLHKSCRRLIWLNPLLRYAGFEPKSKGIKALLPHVDDFRTVHNLASLGDLAQALSRPQPGRPNLQMTEAA